VTPCPRKAENTLGLFVAIAGFEPTAVAAHSGHRSPLILTDGGDVYYIVLDDRFDLLRRTRRHAAMTGAILLTAARILSVACVRRAGGPRSRRSRRTSVACRIAPRGACDRQRRLRTPLLGALSATRRARRVVVIAFTSSPSGNLRSPSPSLSPARRELGSARIARGRWSSSAIEAICCQPSITTGAIRAMVNASSASAVRTASAGHLPRAAA
jgi:hypothetical protein